jgi:uncharacterized protein (TIGR02246 family)
MTSTALAFTIPLFLGLVSPAGPPQTDRNDIRAAIEKQGAAFSAAYSRGDIKSIAAMYTEDAIALPPDADMVRGRQAIEKLWNDALASGIKSLTFTVIDVQSSGDLAVETGTAVIGVQPAGQPASTQAGKYVVLWKREADGQWRLHRDIWNNGAPAK